MRKLLFLFLVGFPLFVLSQNVGDYRTKPATIASWSNVSAWQTYNGSVWEDAVTYPNNFTTKVTVRDITIKLKMDVDITIETGGSMTLIKKLDVLSGYTLRNKNSGNISLSSSRLTINGTYDHAVNGGSVPTAYAWGSASALVFSELTTSIPGGLTQGFKDVEINSSGLVTDFSLNGITFAKLKITNTGSKAIIVDATENWSQDITIEPNGVFCIKDDGRLTATGILTNNGTPSNLLIEASAASSGSLIYNGSAMEGTYKQFISEDVWHLLGIPVNQGAGATLAAFNPASGDAYMRAYETANSAWGDYMYDETTQLNVGQGYEYWTTVNHVASLTGTFNTGNQNFTLLTSGNKYNLLANPYPCAIDWEAVSDKSNALTESVYYYSNTAGTNGYAVYSGVSNSGTYGATQYIPPFQGFFVEQVNGTSMSFSNAVKAHPNTGFYKSTDSEGIFDRLRLQIMQDTLWSETVIVFVEGASNDYDIDYDTKMPVNAYVVAPEIYSIADGEKIMINSIGAYEAIVPLELEILEAGTINLTVTEMSDMQEYTQIQLEDREADEFYSLNDDFQGISFDVVPGIISDRFYVHYATTVGIDDIEEQDASIYSSENRIYLDLKDTDSYQVQIVNMMGQTIYNQQLNGTGIKSITLDQPAAYYLVNVITEKQNITEKLYIAK